MHRCSWVQTCCYWLYAIITAVCCIAAFLLIIVYESLLFSTIPYVLHVMTRSNEPSVKVVPDSYDNNNITATPENYSRRGEDIVTEVPDTANDSLTCPQVKLAPSVGFHCPSLVDECLFGSSAMNGESSKLSKPAASQDFASASHHGSLKVVGVTSKSYDSGYGSRDNKTMSLTNAGSESMTYYETLKVSSQDGEAPPEERMPVTSSLMSKFGGKRWFGRKVYLCFTLEFAHVQNKPAGLVNKKRTFTVNLNG